MKASGYGAQVHQMLLGCDLGIYCARVAQLAIPHFIDGREDEGSASGVSDFVEVTIVDLWCSSALQPYARGGEGVGRYFFIVH